MWLNNCPSIHAPPHTLEGASCAVRGCNKTVTQGHSLVTLCGAGVWTSIPAAAATSCRGGTVWCFATPVRQTGSSGRRALTSAPSTGRQRLKPRWVPSLQVCICWTNFFFWLFRCLRMVWSVWEYSAALTTQTDIFLGNSRDDIKPGRKPVVLYQSQQVCISQPGAWRWAQIFAQAGKRGS